MSAVSTDAPVTAPRVVVVDDNEAFRKGLCDLLEDYEIPIAGIGSNGAEAVRLAESLAPDVILMDLRMPVMDGIEATRAIKRLLPAVRIILLSAYDEQALRDDARDARVFAYVVKGTDPRILRATLMEAWRDGPTGSARNESSR